MSQYLLSTYAVEGEVPGSPGTPEDMQAFMQRVIALEAEIDESGTFVFGGALQGSDAVTVVHTDDEGVQTTRPVRRFERAHRRVLHHQRRRPRGRPRLGRQGRGCNQPSDRGPSILRDRTGG